MKQQFYVLMYPNGHPAALLTDEQAAIEFCERYMKLRFGDKWNDRQSPYYFRNDALPGSTFDIGYKLFTVDDTEDIEHFLYHIQKYP